MDKTRNCRYADGQFFDFHGLEQHRYGGTADGKFFFDVFLKNISVSVQKEKTDDPRLHFRQSRLPSVIAETGIHVRPPYQREERVQLRSDLLYGICRHKYHLLFYCMMTYKK